MATLILLSATISTLSWAADPVPNPFINNGMFGFQSNNMAFRPIPFGGMFPNMGAPGIGIGLGNAPSILNFVPSSALNERLSWEHQIEQAKLYLCKMNVKVDQKQLDEAVEKATFFAARNRGIIPASYEAKINENKRYLAEDSACVAEYEIKTKTALEQLSSKAVATNETKAAHEVTISAGNDAIIVQTNSGK